MLLQMNTLEFTYRIYKTFVKAVPLDSSGAGFHFLKQSIKGRVERDCLNASNFNLK